MKRLPKLLAVDAAALAWPFAMPGLDFRPIETIFPALTCTAQASFRTAAAPACHGIVANGRFDRLLCRAMFWEQSARLVEGRRIWQDLRDRGGRVAMLFWQQSLGECVDTVLSPAPIHKHHGGMIADCYSRDRELYRRLRERLGPFRLSRYWGPLASAKVGDWIAQATAAVLADPAAAPNLCLTYLPSLDYDLQRHGPDSPPAQAARDRLRVQLAVLLAGARAAGYEVLVFGDYAIAPARRAVLPNRALHQAGLLKTRPVADMLYPDFYASDAMALVDHQVAHVYLRAGADVAAAREVLSQLAGVEIVVDRPGLAALGLNHPNAGELVLVAQDGTWFAYPWWQQRRQAPDYAGHVDIHNKPGYDPCELFWGWPPGTVSQDPGRIRGSHGRAAGRPVAWAATCDLGQPATLVELAAAVKGFLDA